MMYGENWWMGRVNRWLGRVHTATRWEWDVTQPEATQLFTSLCGRRLPQEMIFMDEKWGTEWAQDVGFCRSCERIMNR